METLRLIRRITADGLLDNEEVWDLANFLNHSREALNNWPGNILWPTLHSIFDDGVVTSDELHTLGQMLSDVAHKCAAMGELKLTTYIRTRSQKAVGQLLPENRPPSPG